MKNIIYLLFTFIVLSSCKSVDRTIDLKLNDFVDTIKKPFISETIVNYSEPVVTSDINTNSVLPDEVNIDVPFISQAPFANWDELHEEACEEASLLIVHNFLQGIKKNSNEDADKAIISMVNWQVEHYGSHRDLTIEDLASLAKNYYKYKNVKTLSDISIEDIKKQLAAGNPVIVPCAGRDLNNPYFTAPGPIYHMLVIKGYDQNYFITNDVGTKRGENYKYKTDILFNAIHDYNGKDENYMRQGTKKMLIISN